LLEALVPFKEPNSKDIALQWLLSFIGLRYSEEFVNGANQLGLILNGKVMDTESAAAMWEASNVSYKQERIILQYLTAYFGRRFTVPECKIRQLGKDAFMPKCDKCTTSSNKIIPYWYKEIDEVVMHHIKMLLK
jgi:hypothetical protein